MLNPIGASNMVKRAMGAIMDSAFARGQKVRNERGRIGVVRAVFINRDGQKVCAIEQGQELDFVEQSRLSSFVEPEMAP
jgi:hypothetical protein